MSEKIKLKMFLSFVLISLLILGGCGGNNSLNNYITPTFSLTPSPTRKSTPSATAAATATPALNNKIVIITPDDLFALPGLKALSTPDSSDFCEHLPPPQIIANPDRLSLLSGRFSLCVSRSWPWVKTAMDLDTGTLVSSDDKSGDIDMYYTHPDLNREASYFVSDLNNAHIDEIDTPNLTYGVCEKLVLNLEDPGSFDVDEGGIACVLTTEGKMAVIRVEHIYPPLTQGVEFSFSILRNE